MKIIRFVYLDQIYYGELHGDEVILWSDAPWSGGLKLQKKVLFHSYNHESICLSAGWFGKPNVPICYSKSISKK